MHPHCVCEQFNPHAERPFRCICQTYKACQPSPHVLLGHETSPFWVVSSIPRATLWAAQAFISRILLILKQL